MQSTTQTPEKRKRKFRTRKRVLHAGTDHERTICFYDDEEDFESNMNFFCLVDYSPYIEWAKGNGTDGDLDKAFIGTPKGVVDDDMVDPEIQRALSRAWMDRFIIRHECEGSAEGLIRGVLFGSDPEREGRQVYNKEFGCTQNIYDLYKLLISPSAASTSHNPRPTNYSMKNTGSILGFPGFEQSRRKDRSWITNRMHDPLGSIHMADYEFYYNGYYKDKSTWAIVKFKEYEKHVSCIDETSGKLKILRLEQDAISEGKGVVSLLPNEQSKAMIQNLSDDRYKEYWEWNSNPPEEDVKKILFGKRKKISHELNGTVRCSETVYEMYSSRTCEWWGWPNKL